jgi:hypothetical protein
MLEAAARLAQAEHPYLASWGHAIERWCELFAEEVLAVDDLPAVRAS